MAMQMGVQAVPGMTVQVVVPAGMVAGQQMQVDPDGPAGPLPAVLVTIPAGVQPGQMIQVTIPFSAAVALPPCSLPGLEYLLATDKVMCKQKVELFEAFTGFETSNAYELYGDDGNPIFQLAENSECCERQCCGPNRSFEMRVQACNNPAPLLEFIRPLRCTNWPCYMQELTVFYLGQERVPLGGIYQNFACCGQSFTVKDASGADLYDITGPCCVVDLPCCAVEFEIHPPGDAETIIGVISKRPVDGLEGYAKQMFTDADNFSADFPNEATIEAKSLVLGAIMLIDFLFFERGQNQSGGSVGFGDF